MNIDFFGRPFLLLLFSLAPAALSWFSQRSLVAQRDDAVLPERLIALGRRNWVAVWAACSAVAVIGRVADLLWAVPLVVVSLIAAGYPLRRALFDERWSLGEYVGTMLRLMLAVWGLWIVLALLPFLARAAGSLDWLAAIALTAFLLAWSGRWPEIFRWCVRAAPLTDALLLNRFSAIAAASMAPPPRFEVVDLRGGAIANAVALASRRVSSVIYTDALVRLLDADEAAAITAHEVAHLEHFDAARLRRLSQVTSALIVLGGCVALLPRLIPELSVLMLAGIWSVPFVMALAWMARDRQQNETKSDLRAVELTGDPDALIRALTKLHAFALVPRRWDTQTEHVASHPSLARRIRAIREAAGASRTVEIPEPETIAGSSGAVRMTFDADRLHWQESEGVVHVLSYTHLTELRVDARASGSARLVAVEAGGRQWETKLDAAEAGRAQKILDRVDVRLAEPVVRPHTVPLLQVAGALVALCAVTLGHIIVAFVALGASVRSAASFYAAAGASALGAAGIVARQAIATGDREATWPGMLLLVLGVVLLAGAWRTRDHDGPRVVDAAVTALALAALLSVMLIVLRGGNAVRFYQASVAIPSGAILPLALAAALACRSRRIWRLASVPIALVGVLIGVAGSGTFLHAFGRDPLLLGGSNLSIEVLADPPIADFSLPMTAVDVRVSPGGRRVAVQTVTERGEAIKSFAVGIPGGKLSPVEADDLLFLDDDRVLTLIARGPNALVREVALESGAVVWEKPIDDLMPRRLAFRRSTGRWLVAGANYEGSVVSVESPIGHGDIQRREWRHDNEHEWPEAWAVEGDTVVLAESMFNPGMVNEVSWRWTMLVGFDLMMRTQLTKITPTGSKPIAASELSTTCSDVLDATQLVCMAFDGARTHLVSLAPASTTPRPIGSLTGHFAAYRARDKWLSGWVDSRALAIDVESGRAIAPPSELEHGQFTAAGSVAATFAHERPSATRIRLYSLEGSPK